MFRLISSLYIVLACAVALSGCAAPPAGSTSVPGRSSSAVGSESIVSAFSPESPDWGLPAGTFPLQLYFSSGAGGWRTELILLRDGFFSGVYSDSEMGEAGEGYPDGSVYTCTFEGRFSDVRILDTNRRSLMLETLSSDYVEGKEWIKDNIRYESSTPFGLEEGREFVLYLPDTPTAGLSEEFLSWWPLRFALPEEQPATLQLYGLHNVQMGYGFFGDGFFG